MNQVGKHIKKLRKERDLSQEALAELLHVTRQAVSNWENGKTQPDLDMLERLAAVFQVDILVVIYGQLPKQEEEVAAMDEKTKKRHIRGAVLFGCIALALSLIHI